MDLTVPVALVSSSLHLAGSSYGRYIDTWTQLYFRQNFIVPNRWQAVFGYVQTLAVDPLMVSASIDPGRAGFRTVMNVSLEGNTEVSYLRAWSIFLEFEPGLWKGSGFILFSGHRCTVFLLSSLYIERGFVGQTENGL